MDYKNSYDQYILEHGSLRAAINFTYSNYNSGNLGINYGTKSTFIPGQFYVIDYIDVKKASRVISNEQLYYDFNPVILSLGQEEKLEVALNLNLIPIQLRKVLFERVSKLNNIKLNKELLNKIFKIKSNIGINKYDRKFIKKVKHFEPKDFHMVSFLYTNKLKFNRKNNINSIFKILV